MVLQGMLETVFGRFVTLRGYARMGDLARASYADYTYQRDLITVHEDEMKKFLDDRNFLFFPEVVLSTNLSEDNFSFADSVYSSITSGQTNIDISDEHRYRLKFSTSSRKRTGHWDTEKFRRAEMKIYEKAIASNGIFSRIDGNHRLSVVDKNPGTDGQPGPYDDLIIPFSIILFRNKADFKFYDRIIFHNINYKQIPIKKEHHLELIFENPEIFPDEFLKENEAFDWQYYFARKLYENLNNSRAVLTIVSKVLLGNERTFFLNTMEAFLKERDGNPACLKKEEASIDIFMDTLNIINNKWRDIEVLRSCKNTGLLGAFIYYQLVNTDLLPYFEKWVLKNELYRAEELHPEELIKIFNVISSKVPKKVFLARWYPTDADAGEKTRAEHRLNALKQLVENDLELELVDMGTEEGGTELIHPKMYEAIRSSDIIIGDLTGHRPNVHIEIGYALSHQPQGRLLLMFQPKDGSDKVPFDTNSFRYEEITDSAEIAIKLRPHIEAIITEVGTGELQ